LLSSPTVTEKPGGYLSIHWRPGDMHGDSARTERASLARGAPGAVTRSRHELHRFDSLRARPVVSRIGANRNIA